MRPRFLGVVLVAVPCLGQQPGPAPARGLRERPPTGFEVFVREATARALETASALARDAESARFDRLVVTAGRPVPPGLAARRVAERRVERDAALADLRPLVEAFGGRGRNRLAAMLAATDEQLRWRTAARVAAELDLLELAPAIGEGLAVDRAPATRATARRALHRLTRRWFADVGRFRAFWTRAGWTPESELGREFLLAPLEAAEVERREHLVRWLRHEPESALSWLDDPDPETRRAVAGVVGVAIGEGRLEPRGGVRALLDRIAVEADPIVFHALVEEALAPLAGELPDAAPVARLRAILESRLDEGPRGIEITLAHALARLPWITGDAEADPELLARAGVARALDAFAALLEGLDDTGPFADPDVRIACLQELSIVVDAARAAGRDELLGASSAREVVARWLVDRELFEGVRVTAARALATFAAPDDVETLLAALERADSSLDLRFAILGSLKRIAARLDPAGPIAVELARRLQAIVSDPDPELRRRALALFTDEAGPLLYQHLDHDALLERFATEPVDELRVLLFELLTRDGDADRVGPILATPAFDAFLTTDASRPGWTVRKLAPLCAARGPLLVELAEHVEAIPHPPTRAARLSAALFALARLDDASARRLSADAHRAAVSWALELRRFGVRLPAAAEGGGLFLRRLVDVHVDQCVAAGARGAGPCLHAKAILGSELAQLDGTADLADLEALFQSALDYANEHERGEAPDEVERLDAWTIRRDRARVRAALEDRDGALTEYGAVVEGRADVLTPFDLRLAGRLFAERGAASEAEAGSTRVVPAARSDWLEATGWTWRLVHREEWSAEPLELRRADVAELVERAVRAADRGWLDRIVALLATFPTDGAEPTGVWSGLTDPMLANELPELRAKLDGALAALSPTGSDSSSPDEPTEAPAPDSPTANGR